MTDLNHPDPDYRQADAGVPLPRRWLTITQFCKRNPAWTVAAMRQLVHRAQKDNRVSDSAMLFRPAISKTGTKVLIDEDVFLGIVGEHTLDKLAGMGAAK